jgi:membrane-associated phospholipid phosphatase
MKPWSLLACAMCCIFVCSRQASAVDAVPLPIDLSLAATAADATPSYPEPEAPLSFDYLKLLWADTKEIAVEPLQWDGDDWRKFGLISGGLVVTGALLDKPIRDAAQRGRSAGSDRFFGDIQRFGTKQYGLPVLAGFYVYGAAADDSEAKAVALDGFSADVISALVTSTIKGVVGRARPNTGLGPHHFSPLQGDYSFPSGHATGAFAFASVIAAHYDSPWVDTAAYGIASLVGVARIQLDAHWTSDVIGGALIGGLIGHHLVNFNRELREKYPNVAPVLSTDGQQLLLTWEF